MIDIRVDYEAVPIDIASVKSGLEHQLAEQMEFYETQDASNFTHGQLALRALHARLLKSQGEFIAMLSELET